MPKTSRRAQQKALQQAENNQPRKRGNKKGAHVGFGWTQPNPMKMDFTGRELDVSKAVSSVQHWAQFPVVKTDEDIAERLTEFFTYSAENGQYPSVEKMALALGVDMATVNNWQAGRVGTYQTQAASEMIKKAKMMIAAIDAELVTSGKMNPVPYIFRAKNFHGMRDQVETIVTKPANEQSTQNLEDKYKDVIEIDAEVEDVPVVKKDPVPAETQTAEPPKRGRGRPRKPPVPVDENAPKRKRGRPRKYPLPEETQQ